jgi:Gpi18-like mannosyltransferase
LFYSAAAAAMSGSLRLDPVLIEANQLATNVMDRSAGWLYSLLGVWERFDTLWYMHIAATGYDRPDAVVFYPLYPALIAGANLVIGNALVSALLIGTVSAGFLMFGITRLVALDDSHEVVRRSLLVWGAWPASFMFFAGYAESTLLALVVWAIYAARRRWWLAAGMLGLLAGLTKAAGAVVIIPLGVIAWRNGGRRAWPMCLAALGPVAYMSCLKLTGRLLPSEAYPLYWKTVVEWPWNTVADIFHQISTGGVAVGLNFAIFIASFAFALARKQRPEYMAYTLALLFLFLTKRSDPTQQQWARYALLVFPAWSGAAHLITDRGVLIAVLTAFGAINLILLKAFLEWSMVV